MQPNYLEGPKEVTHFFPSVESGTIDCSRAKKELAWKPTPLVSIG
jgi:nucleoside-diphosphate-sugar epimerase